MNAQVDVPGCLSLLRTLAPAGFSVALHARFQTATYVFHTYPLPWVEEYTRKGLVIRDPSLAWAWRGNTGVVAWEDLAAQDPGGVIAAARSHGLVHGIAIGLDRDGSRSLGNFARGDRPFTPEEIGAIQDTMAKLHDATASAAPLSDSVREGLRRMSVVFTHP